MASAVRVSEDLVKEANPFNIGKSQRCLFMIYKSSKKKRKNAHAKE